MSKIKLTSHLKLLFFGAVVVPCLFLAFMAIRSINREKAYIEKRFQETYSTEVTNVISLVTGELDALGRELDSGCSSEVPDPPEDSLRQWKAGSPLVGVPFLLSPQFEILWPLPGSSTTDEEITFLNWNRDFITDRDMIPVFTNIAYLYKDQITAGLPESRLGESAPPQEKPAAAKILADAEGFDAEAKAAQAPPGDIRKRADTAGKEDKTKTVTRPSVAVEQQQQQALREFEKSESLRQQVYQQAKEKGQQTEPRTVMPDPISSRESNEALRSESIFISEPRRFSEIIMNRESGIIPRFIDEKLALLFWKKASQGRIVGCVLDQQEFRGRLMLRLPEPESSDRILTLLDENGIPVFQPGDNTSRDWRRPFVAREISELLPRWEAAVYLTDPGLITSRANQIAVIMWILVVLFLISITGGGTLVLKALQSEMDLAAKKTTFVTNVSHELKTPLTSIRMFAEMLKEGRQPDAMKREKYLNLMVSETERLTRLINNVLDFSRTDKGKKPYQKKPVDLVVLVEDTVESQRPHLEQNGFLVRYGYETGTAVVRGDEESLKQAVLNLISNAEKYSTATKEIDVEVTRTGEFALLNIKDRGVGIPSKHAQSIFKEFFRVDESLTSAVRGSGLGLPIARRIVRDHLGDILFFPREGGGSVFQIKIPLDRGRDRNDEHEG